MTVVTIQSVGGTGTLDGVAGGYVDLVDEQGQPVQLRFHLQTVAPLVDALAQSAQTITAGMTTRGETVGEQLIAKNVVQYDFGHDPQAQVAVMKVRFTDQSTLPVQFNKHDLKAVIGQLSALLKTLDEAVPPPLH